MDEKSGSVLNIDVNVDHEGNVRTSVIFQIGFQHYLRETDFNRKDFLDKFLNSIHHAIDTNGEHLS